MRSHARTPTDPARPPALRRWLAALALLLAVVAIGQAGPFAAAAVLRPGPPVSVGGHVRFFPLTGWSVTGRITGPYQGVRLARGSATLDVVTPARPVPNPVPAYVAAVLASRFTQLRLGATTTARLPNGPALRVFYLGASPATGSVEGELTFLLARPPTAAVGPPRLVIFDAWAPRGQLMFELQDINLMIERTRVS
jgi:hypothetical protein